MRRFSQRNSLVTLSDINITPLLDLAFVLLIIFVITTPLLEQGMDLKLPVGGKSDSRKLDPKDIRTIEISSTGLYMLSKKWMSLEQATEQIIKEFRHNPRLKVDVRADERVQYKYVAAVLDRLEGAGLEEISMRTEPQRR